MAKRAKAKSRRPAVKAKKAVVRRRSARSQALPGFEQVRSVKLDNLCEEIGDERATMNTARVEEKSLTTTALQVMQKAGVTVYKHAKIELVRVPGSEKLRVRVVKDQGDATVKTGATRADNAEVADDMRRLREQEIQDREAVLAASGTFELPEKGGV